MRVPDFLNRLDRWVLPPIGRALARLGRGARRLRAVRIGAVVVSLAVVLVAVYAAGRSPAANNTPSGAIVSLGVQPGGSIPDYVTTSRAKLRAVIAGNPTTTRAPEFYALVSFSAYLPPDRLTSVLAGPPLQVTNVFMRVPSKFQTAIIKINAFTLPQDVTRAMAATATEKAHDVQDFEMLYAQVKGSTAEDETLRATYRLGATVAASEEVAYRGDCACVYAAVVYATPAALGALAARPDVRVVEPAPAQQLLDRAVFRPPFPDQDGLAPGSDPSAAPGP
jgi:hypothetical protein